MKEIINDLIQVAEQGDCHFRLAAGVFRGNKLLSARCNIESGHAEVRAVRQCPQLKLYGQKEIR